MDGEGGGGKKKREQERVQRKRGVLTNVRSIFALRTLHCIFALRCCSARVCMEDFLKPLE